MSICIHTENNMLDNRTIAGYVISCPYIYIYIYIYYTERNVYSLNANSAHTNNSIPIQATMHHAWIPEFKEGELIDVINN